MIAVAGFVHAKGVGFEFQDLMKACRWSRNARLESKLVTVGRKYSVRELDLIRFLRR